MLASLFLIGAALATPGMTVQQASQAIVDESGGGLTEAVNRMVGGIISYVGWPGRRAGDSLTLCQVGTPRLASSLAPDIPGDRPLSLRKTSAGAVIANGGCDILYLGRLSSADRMRLVQWVRARPVLTITDDDPACLYGAMFCLAHREAGLSFSVNLDAIARGPLRVDPRVLQIGRSVS
ncbi:YfiR family protein [Sphingopyxis indica]|uniref:DUF4154 domain-containing protein n=1 Tax=Sphingopyxis indica TaxID=436663 RepID=A0A239GWH0_9SPHN|nr:YfiR family protein [Sphingopyxis indica]SNS73559.1 protein of unknown function [Sphingopyxis indica]